MWGSDGGLYKAWGSDGGLHQTCIRRSQCILLVVIVHICDFLKQRTYLATF